jgi:putative oxidoreductase
MLNLNPWDFPDAGQLILQSGVGLFFAISGYHKLFNKERHASLVQTLTSDGIPFVRFNQWWVPGVEFVAGTFLALGLFSVVSATMLLVICLVACAVDGWDRVKAYKPIDKADWLDDILYLPEVMYALILLHVILAGPGRWSIDNLLFL